MALIVVGINHEDRLVPVGEGLWLSKTQSYEAPSQLAHVAGIREAVILAMCKRTEFALLVDDTDDFCRSTS